MIHCSGVYDLGSSDTLASEQLKRINNPKSIAGIFIYFFFDSVLFPTILLLLKNIIEISLGTHVVAGASPCNGISVVVGWLKKAKSVSRQSYTLLDI